MPLGDIATWFSGIASASAVVTAVWIALAGNSKEQRLRQARGRLKAAYLYHPIGRTHALMEAAQQDFAQYIRITAGTASSDVAQNALRLQGMCVEVDSLLSKFDVADAADLPQTIGVKLADALGEAQMVIDLVGRSTRNYLNTGALQQSDQDQTRFESASRVGFVEPMFGKAVSDLGQFIDFCRREFHIPL
jgi:hypothetical protein